jgi:hypothetical protein
MRFLSPEPGLRSRTDGAHKRLAEEALHSLRQLDQLMRETIVVTPYEVRCYPSSCCTESGLAMLTTSHTTVNLNEFN